MKLADQLLSRKIIPDPLKDQFFLTDEKIIQKMIDLADLKQDDTVLEIGAGTGNLTRVLAKKAGKVISFEIDEKFKPFLIDLPSNVQMHFEDAWEYIQLHGKFWKKKEYNKIVANLPYSFAEKFLHNLTFLIYDKAILIIPQSLANKIAAHPIFSSFFKVEEKLKINRKKFYPVPKTNSVIIDLIKLPDALKNKNLPLFLKQYLYQYENHKIKNSLREGLIKYLYLTSKKRMTKNEARKIIAQSGINQELLNKPPDNSEIYQQVSEKFKNLI